MEHRESPRPFGRLVTSPGVTRIALNRLALALLGALAGLLLLGLLISYLSDRAADRVSKQPLYQLAFTEIELDPPPPDWYRGGSRTFLAHVRDEAQAPASLSALEVKLDQVDRWFRLYAWVDGVKRVERVHPNRIIVRLVYRDPVAFWDKAPPLVIDADGVILPKEDMEPEAVERLPLLAAVAPPVDPRPGLSWRSGSAARIDEGVAAAGRLGKFLQTVGAAKDPTSVSFRPHAIHGVAKDRLFLEYLPRIMVLWGNPPGDESAREPAAKVKWSLLRQWFQENPRPALRYPDHLVFTKTGVRVRTVRADASSER